MQECCLSFQFAQVAAGTDEVWELAFPMTGTWRLKKAYFQAMTNITASATNYTDMSLNLGTTEVASEQTTVADTGNITAGTAEELVLTATGKSLEVAQGGRVTFKKTDAGTGVAIDGSVTLEFVKVGR